MWNMEKKKHSERHYYGFSEMHGTTLGAPVGHTQGTN
jgi:hypothetical protein